MTSCPVMWGDYISASTAIKITRDSEPRLLADDIRSNWTTEKRRANPRFFDDSLRQPGRHIFSNRLKHLNDLQYPWHHPPPSNDIIRVLLKKHFNFDFETTQPEQGVFAISVCFDFISKLFLTISISDNCAFHSHYLLPRLTKTFTVWVASCSALVKFFIACKIRMSNKV